MDKYKKYKFYQYRLNEYNLQWLTYYALRFSNIPVRHCGQHIKLRWRKKMVLTIDYCFGFNFMIRRHKKESSISLLTIDHAILYPKLTGHRDKYYYRNIQNKILKHFKNKELLFKYILIAKKSLFDKCVFCINHNRDKFIIREINCLPRDIKKVLLEN